MKTAKTVSFVVWVMVVVAASILAEEKPKYGAIEVVSEPAASRVYIEGFRAGETSVKVEQILPGEYRVVVKKEGYDDFTQDVRVTAGEISKVKASLSRDSGGWHPPLRSEDDWTPVLDKDKDRYEQAKSKKRLNNYKVLEISNFLMKSDEEVPPDHLYAMLRDIGAELDKETKFQVFLTNYTRGPSPRWKESGADVTEPTLILSGVITRYQRGSRVKRRLVGVGAGKTRMYCLFRLVDKKTGEVLLERMENGSISGGVAFFGGPASVLAMKELAEDIAHVIKENW